jgi:hypothetical protein
MSDGFAMGYQYLPFIRHLRRAMVLLLTTAAFHLRSKRQFYTLLIVRYRVASRPIEQVHHSPELGPLFPASKQ